MIAKEVYNFWLSMQLRPITGYHKAWSVSVDVYVDTGEQQYIENRKYIYLWARNSPSKQFWYPVVVVYTIFYTSER